MLLGPTNGDGEDYRVKILVEGASMEYHVFPPESDASMRFIAATCSRTHSRSACVIFSKIKIARYIPSSKPFAFASPP